MLLKFCDDNFIFYITHMKYFDILCYFIVLFFIVLCILIQNDSLVNKVKNHIWQKITIIVSSGLFVGFLFFLFIWLLSDNSFNGCVTKYNEPLNFKIDNIIQTTNNHLEKSKIIIVGDSRMELIEDDKEINIPFNVEFVAKSAMMIDWFENEALPKINKILKDNNYNYSVIINMGVNDLNNEEYKGEEVADNYFKLYEEFALNHSNVKLYLLSVNPIDEKKRNITEPNNKRTTKKIELFNKTIVNKIKKTDVDNIQYCDSYNTLKFKTDDGIHYTQDTNKRILKYIINDCVQY